MEIKVIKLLKNNGGMLSFNELAAVLDVKDHLDFLDMLRTLEAEHHISISQNNNIYLLNESKYHHGILKLNAKGFGFVSDLEDDEHDDYFVPPVSLNGTFTSDEVVYVIKTEADGRIRAEIVELIKREKTSVIGEITRSRDGKFLDFIPMDQSFSNFRVIMVNKNDLDLKDNLLVKAKILELKDRKLFVRVKKIIGDASKASDRIMSIAEEFDIRTEFMTKTIRNAEEVNIPLKDQPDLIKSRMKESLMDKMIVTIDGADSKDLDDAIGVEKLDNGHYKLTVAIADVSHYVQPKSALDNEALIRGNSTYLANKVIPMLPKILSDDLCSLNPGTEKLALACEMEFNEQGHMLSKCVFETIIFSKARLTYSEVNDFFADGTWTKGQDVADMITIARELHKLIDAVKEKRGTINFGVREAKIVMDAESNVIGIKARETGESEKLIENFMVSANEAVAELVFDRDLPYVYRNHGKPEEEDLITWYSLLKSFGIDPKLTNKEMTDPLNINKALKQIDEQTKDPIERELLNLSLLRYMDKAKYGIENIGHFGLASKCYTHFTSPIRRYSDLMVHRYLKQYILNKDTRDFMLEKNAAFIERATGIINDTEVASVSCEREVNKACMVEYMADKVGQIYEGTISIALKFGIFVQLDNMVEGLVHITNLEDGISYDEVKQVLIKKDNTFYRMGQKVKIQVIGADIKKRTIDFKLV
ncbi:ribonuclease R [[Acholeplasma] multilocale]|uniref:ribonuclease R n=1 Tax=[Acholeplasma] multilocale TaxID=264638 RepID=UPI00047EA8CB|nr:ribonuclease R [[Acholeplasma] multilocale]